MSETGRYLYDHKLSLNNFMLFEQAEIDWSKNINVICGENSTGKTTLLKVMYTMVKPLSKGKFENGTREMEELQFVGKLQGVFRPDEMKIGRLVSQKQGSNRTDFKSLWLYLLFLSTPISK